MAAFTNTISNLNQMHSENGTVIIEATFVFPIMFIILFFLIYMGNAFYMKAQVESVVEHLFGQLSSKLATNTKTMTIICVTLTFSICLFVIAPVLTGWSLGYLDSRAVYDLQISSRYNDVYEVENLPDTDYGEITAFIEQNNIAIKDDLTFSEYLPQKSDFHQRVKYDFPPLAIALKDYNAVRKMLGYEPIILQTDEFATHWHRAAEDKDIENYIAEHTLLETDAGTLKPVSYTHLDVYKRQAMCFIAMTTGYTFSITEKNSMDRLFGILPVRKSELVIGRYVFVLAMGLLSLIISLIAQPLVLKVLGETVGVFDIVTAAIAGVFLFALYTVFQIPGYYKYGSIKGRVFMYIPVAGFLVTLLLLSKMPAIGKSIISVVESSPILLVFLAVFAIVVMYAVSIFLSIRVMKNKEM